MNPTVNGGNSPYAKIAYLAFVAVWALLVLDLTTANPPQWLVVVLTGLNGVILGKMWDVEVKYWIERFGQVTITVGDDDE